MSRGRLDKWVVTVLVSLLLFPAALPAGLSGGAPAHNDVGESGIVSQRAAPDHNRTISINDFSGMQMSKLANLSGGGVGLQLGAGAWRPEFVVDFLAGKNKDNPAIAANSKNELIITWEDLRNGAGNMDIYAQRYDPRGNTLGGDIAVCTLAGWQSNPTIAVGSQDDFMIAWHDLRSGTASDIYAQRFDGDGNKVGGDVQVSTSGNSWYPRMAADSVGDFLVTWVDGRNNASTYLDIYAQMLDRNGTKAGAEIPVCTAAGNQTDISIACDSRDRFIIAWQDGRNAGKQNIYALRYDAKAGTAGNAFAVSAFDIPEFYPSVAIYPNDDFIISWSDRRNGLVDVYAQKFDRNATPVGGEISAVLSGFDKDVSVIAVNSFSYTFMAWMDRRATSGDIYGQWFDPGMSKFGPEVLVASAPNQQRAPAITIDPKDDITVCWVDLRSVTEGNVYARQVAYPYQTPGTLTTGDLSDADLWAWSDVTANASVQNASANTVSFDLSTDSGATWHAVPANGSLEAAGAAPKVRIRATLATTDDMSTPVIHNISVNCTVNRPPQIDTIPQTSQIWRNTVVTFPATASDPDGDELAYKWEQVAGPNLTLMNATSPNVSLMTDRFGNYTLRLTVSDGFNESPPAIANFTVINRMPAVRVMNDSLEVLQASINRQKNTNITLKAKGYDEDGDNLTFCWTQTFGSPDYLNVTNTSEVSFYAYRAGHFGFNVTVNDGYEDSVPASIDLWITSAAPTPRLTVNTTAAIQGEYVFFNASASNKPDGNITAYNFEFGDGTQTGYGPNSTAVHAYASTGNFSADVVLRDEDGNEVKGGPVNISVYPTGIPRLTITSPKEGQVVNTRRLAVTFTVEYFTVYLDGSHLHFQLDNGTEVMWFSTTAYTLPGLTEGNHVLRAYLVDQYHAHLPGPFTSVTVNFAVRQLPAPPDLAVTYSDIKIRPADPKEGVTVTLSVTLFNAGTADSGQFSVRFIIDNIALPDEKVAFLAKGGSIVRETKWKATAGTHTVRVLLDPFNYIDEADKGNNEANRTFTVGPKGQKAAAELPWALVGILLAIVAIAAIVAVVLMRSKRPPETMPAQTSANAPDKPAGSPPASPPAPPEAALPPPPPLPPQQPLSIPPP